MNLQTHALLALISCWTVATSVFAQAEETAPLTQAHAHNDYYHDRPLLDALERAFCSIEADVFLANNQLLVGHARYELQADRSLESLYLQPLYERIQREQGWVYEEEVPLLLLIDIKSGGTETFQALHRTLAKYEKMLTVVKDGKLHEGPVHVVVSGNRDIETIAASVPRRVGIDGRLPDLERDLDPTLFPLVSDNWRNHFQWRGRGEMPAAERDKLAQLTQLAQDRGVKVRFWATPESPALWSELLRAQVDLIGTDKLDLLSDFLKRRRRGE